MLFLAVGIGKEYAATNSYDWLFFVVKYRKLKNSTRFSISLEKQISLSSECQDFERKIQYPEARRNNSVVDDFHGTKVFFPLYKSEKIAFYNCNQFIETKQIFR